MVPKNSSAKNATTVPTRNNILRQSMRIGIVAATMALGLIRPRLDRAQGAPTTGSPPPSFEVASIKPNRSGDMRFMIMFRPGRFTAKGTTLKGLVAIAYNVKDFQISGGPSWTSSERYDIDAKEPDAFAEQLQKLPPDQRGKQMGLMLQALLRDRFELKVSRATKDLPIYALVVAKNGPKLQEAKPGDTYQNGIKAPDGKPIGQPGMIRMGPGQFIGQGVTMAAIVGTLSQRLGRPVVDQTGLQGNYDITLQWAPDQATAGVPMGPVSGNPKPDGTPPPENSGPSIFTALQEQLGLKLDSTKGPVDILVIDHIEKPTEN